MTAIKDIRIYRSEVENIDGNPHPGAFSNRELHIIAHRIVMKLREYEFTLGDFNHLYINLTACLAENETAPARRSIDKIHKWYRYYDAGISRELFDTLETPRCIQAVVDILERVLQKYFTSPQFDAEFIHSCVSEAVAQGEKMLMRFKEKKSAKNKAVIYLRLLDNGRYFPLLRVFDKEDDLIFEKDLPETNELEAYGEIRLSEKKITINPRKNYNARGLEPMTFIL